MADDPMECCMDDSQPINSFNLQNRDVLVQLLTQHYMYLVNRINTRDFLTFLYQEGCLTLADKEEIQHMITSIDKASHLIDLVIRKDLRAIQNFYEVLEYNYEECFIKITQQKPRPKPPDWKPQNSDVRHSTVMLQGILTTLSGLMQQISQDRDHMCNLAHQVQSVWEKESADDEHDHQNIKTRLDHLKTENVNLTVENNLLKQRYQRERSKSKKLFQTSQEIMEMKQKLRESKEEVSRLNTYIKLKNVVQAFKTPTDVRVESLSEEVSKLKEQLKEYENELRNERDSKEKQGDQLDSLERSNDDLNEQKQNLIEENTLYKTKLEQLEHRFYWLERQQSRNWRNKEGPAHAMDSRAAFPHCTRNYKIHNSSEPVYDCMNPVLTYERSGYHIEEPLYHAVVNRQLPPVAKDVSMCSQPTVGVESGEDDPLYCTVPSSLNTVQMRQKSFEESFVERISKEFRYSCGALEAQQSIEEEPSGFYRRFTLKLNDFLPNQDQQEATKYPRITSMEVVADDFKRKLKIEGGNHSGIFIANIEEELSNTDGHCKLDLQKGDQLIKAKTMDAPTAKCLGDCTLEEATSIIESLRGNIKLHTWRKTNIYENFKRIDLDGDYKGDLFCVYVLNTPSHTDKTQLQVSPGDVLLVTDTMSHKEDLIWKARKLDPLTGKELHPLQHGFIPSISRTKISSIRRRLPKESPVKAYSYVQPCQAKYKRPLIICGAETVVDEMVKVLSTDAQFEVLKKPEHIANKINNHPTKVLVLPQQQNLVPELIKSNIYPIVLVINGEMTDIDSEFLIPEYIIEKYKLPSANVDIVNNTIDCVNRLQYQIIWMEGDRPSTPQLEVDV